MDDLLTSQKAAKYLGIIYNQFVRIAKNVRPSDTYKHKSYKNICRLWGIDKLDELKNTEIVKKAIERNKKQQKKKELEKSAFDEKWDCLDFDSLLNKALECMHSLNRRAKHYSSTMSSFHIYGLKNDFLSYIVEYGLANVYSFYDDMLYDEHDEYDVDGLFIRPWCFIECRGYKFHQPLHSVTKTMIQTSKPIEPHDTTQPPREIPNITELNTIEKQKSIVEKVIVRLKEKGYDNSFQVETINNSVDNNANHI